MLDFGPYVDAVFARANQCPGSLVTGRPGRDRNPADCLSQACLLLGTRTIPNRASALHRSAATFAVLLWVPLPMVRTVSVIEQDLVVPTGFRYRIPPACMEFRTAADHVTTNGRRSLSFDLPRFSRLVFGSFRLSLPAGSATLHGPEPAAILASLTCAVRSSARYSAVQA